MIVKLCTYSSIGIEKYFVTVVLIEFASWKKVFSCVTWLIKRIKWGSAVKQAWTTATLSSMCCVDGQPLLAPSSTDSLPSLNRVNHVYTVVWDNIFPYAFESFWMMWRLFAIWHKIQSRPFVVCNSHTHT